MKARAEREENELTSRMVAMMHPTVIPDDMSTAFSTVGTEATIFRETPAPGVSELESETMENEKFYAASEATSVNSETGGREELPLPEPPGELGTPFQCNICFRMVDLGSYLEWKLVEYPGSFQLFRLTHW